MEAIGEIGQVVNGQPMQLPYTLKSSWDYTNKIEATVSEALYDGQVIKTTTVTDWRQVACDSGAPSAFHLRRCASFSISICFMHLVICYYHNSV